MNIHFNLQPWREEQRKIQKQKFISFTVIIALLTIGLLAFNYYVETNYIQTQEEVKQSLNSEITMLASAKKEVDKLKSMNEELVRQIGVINKLQEQRQRALRVMDAVAAALPNTVFLNKFTLNKDEIVLDGVAENEASVATLMRNISKIKNLKTPQLKLIETAKSTDRYIVPEDTAVKSFEVVSLFYKDAESKK